ncbi:MAG: hypothetical protein J6A09_01495, partial [Alphaproteobacteria bacterium]|nr:hypothetical protein [Alphaproteobacteria bacterium]
APKQEDQGSEQEEDDKATKFEGSLVSVANTGSEAYGGAIYNAGEIDKLMADFSENTAEVIDGGAGVKVWGGALANVYEKNLYKSTAVTVLKDVDVTFKKNIARVSAGDGAEVLGGAVYNSGEIVNMQATFSGNTADSLYDPEAEKQTKSSGSSSGIVKKGKGVNYAYGGALYNEGEHGKIQNLQADFTENNVIGDLAGAGGAIYNKDGVINNISGYEEGKRAQFSDNTATIGDLESGATPGVRSVQGGAIYNGGVINTVNAEFSGNKALGKADTNVEGGAVYNSGVMTFKDSDFKDNIAQTGSGKGSVHAYGGAVYNSGTITFINSNFSGNKVSGTGVPAQGGAIYSAGGEVNIIAQGKNSTFSGNYVSKSSNAIYMQDGTLNLTAKEEGNVIFKDNISGFGYEAGKGNYVRNYVLNINGDGSGLTYDEKIGKWVPKRSNTGEIYFNNKTVDNIKTLNLNDKSVLHLGKTTQVNTYDFNGNGGFLKIDMAVNKANNIENSFVQNGIINVLNDVTGNTDVVLNSNGGYYSGANSVFLRAPNDDLSTASSFNIAAVYGSPYAWVAKLNYGGETVGSNWYMVIDMETKNPNGGGTGGGGTGEGGNDGD